MLSILSIVLFCVGICQCSTQDDNLLKYPIVGTSYMVHFDKELRKKQFQETILDQTVTLNGTGFWTKLDDGKTFPKDESKVLPLLPKHPLLVKRKTDTAEGKIQIEIDWSKDYFASQRLKQQLQLEVILYNYRGDKLGKIEFTKHSKSEKPQTHDTNIEPLSTGQRYSYGEQADASDLLVAVIRVKATGDSCPWTFLIVYPEQLTDAKGLSGANDWGIEKIIEQQSAFMSMSMLVTGDEWIQNAHKFAMLTWFSQAAGMTEAEFEEDKYLSAIAVPKSGGGGTYSIRDIGQRSGAGFGFLYWNTTGHRFSQKFVNHFKTKDTINNNMFKEFVRICFAYGEILDARSKEEMDNNAPENGYRNKVRNDNWNYNFDGHKISGNRKMSEETGGTVKEIEWTFDISNSWKTTANGKIIIKA